MTSTKVSHCHTSMLENGATLQMTYCALNEGVLHYGNRFQTFRWQYQGVLLTSVILSRLGCTFIGIYLFRKKSHSLRYCTKVSIFQSSWTYFLLSRLGTLDKEHNSFHIQLCHLSWTSFPTPISMYWIEWSLIGIANIEIKPWCIL